MSKTTKQAAVESPAEEITQAADAVGASVTAMQEELAETIKANEELTARVDALTELSNSLSDEKNALLLQLQQANERADEAAAKGGDVSLALAQSQEHNEKLASELEAAREQIERLVNEPASMPSDAQIHERWIAAGGNHAQAEVAKRFAEALLS